MMSKLLPLGLGMSLGLLLLGCRAIKPEASVEGLPEACCTSADPKLQSFKGCRIPQRSCKSRKGEKFWMRGDVACGPVDAASCEGGRCCHYRPQYDKDLNPPIENWAPPGFDKPTNNVTDPDAKPQHDLPAPEAGGKAKPAEPAEPAEPEPEPEPEPSEAVPE
jgi:hypothetical protein